MYSADGPKFKDKVKHVSVDRNGRAELKCEADGNPTAEITWTRQGTTRVLHSSSTYVIPSVREGMFGVYTCIATVIGFYEISRDIYVTENGKIFNWFFFHAVRKKENTES